MNVSLYLLIINILKTHDDIICAHEFAQLVYSKETEWIFNANIKGKYTLNVNIDI